jgi:hypothetical protein
MTLENTQRQVRHMVVEHRIDMVVVAQAQDLVFHKEDMVQMDHGFQRNMLI